MQRLNFANDVAGVEVWHLTHHGRPTSDWWDIFAAPEFWIGEDCLWIGRPANLTAVYPLSRVLSIEGTEERPNRAGAFLHPPEERLADA